MTCWVRWVSILLLGSGLAMAEPEHDEDHEDRAQELEQLERNVRLEFKLVPLDEGDQGVVVVVASPDFRSLRDTSRKPKRGPCECDFSRCAL